MKFGKIPEDTIIGGEYTIKKYLSEGQFKQVYLAASTNPDIPQQDVALVFWKSISEHIRKAFITENEILMKLNHEHILRCYDFFEYEGSFFSIVEFLRGNTLGAMLNDKLRQEKVFSEQEALYYSKQIASALVHAHQQHIIHRDIKPENIMITRDDKVKVLDFGLARILGSSRERAESVVGTVIYMAPEQFKGASGKNIDIWALGVMLYEMLTGRHPFERAYQEHAMYAIMNEDPDFEWLKEQHPISDNLVQIVRKCLQKNPQHRYQRAEDLLTDINKAANKGIVVNTFENRLFITLKAHYPLLYVVTHEEERFVKALQATVANFTAEGKEKKVVYWSLTDGFYADWKFPENKKTIGDPFSALRTYVKLTADRTNTEEIIFVFFDIYAVFKQRIEAKQQSILDRFIQDAIWLTPMSSKSLIFVGTECNLNRRFLSNIMVLNFELPSETLIMKLIEQFVCRTQEKDQEMTPPDQTLNIRLRQALSGFTEKGIQRTLSKAFYSEGKWSERVLEEIFLEKREWLKKTSSLEFVVWKDSFEHVGGLHKLKAWLQQRKIFYSDQAERYGLSKPRGVILYGIPGCGKSLCAKAVANEWELPLIRLDLSRVFGALLGESEKRLKQALKTVDTVSPAVLWIDEIEKALAGIGNTIGSGVVNRIFGTLLTWLVEKKSTVFIVVTANDISRLPPEFFNSDRFDGVFFVDLPDEQGCEEIVKIQLKAIHVNQSPAHRIDLNAFDYPVLGKLCAERELSGAEIRKVVQNALYESFEMKKPLAQQALETEIKALIPLAITFRERIEFLRNFSKKFGKRA